MKMTLVSLLVLFGAAATAEVRTVDITQHVIREEGRIKVRLVAKDVKTDGCNHYGLAGDFRKVEVPEGTQTLAQDFVADFGIYSTEMFCGKDIKPGVVTLETQWLRIADARWVSIYAPKGWILEIAR